MKNLKKTLGLFLILGLFINCNFVYAQNNEPSKEVIKNQKESIQVYQKLYKEINKNSKKIALNDNCNLSEEYAGAYIDEEGYLNILLKDKKDENKNKIQQITNSEKIKFHDAKYSKKN